MIGFALFTFLYLFTPNDTHETPALMMYCQLVQDLAARDYNWFYYDENFLFLHQTQASQVPWATVHWELWLRSQNSSPRRSSNVPTAQNASRKPPILSVPRGFCYKFHRLLVVRLVGQSVFLDIQPLQRLSCQRLHQQRSHRHCRMIWSQHWFRR